MGAINIQSNFEKLKQEVLVKRNKAVNVCKNEYVNEDKNANVNADVDVGVDESVTENVIANVDEYTNVNENITVNNHVNISENTNTNADENNTENTQTNGFVNKFVIRAETEQEELARHTFYLKPATIEKISYYADALKMGKSELVRKIIEDALDNIEILD